MPVANGSVADIACGPDFEIIVVQTLASREIP